ncbi:hypothetical protein CPB84DRAFT_1849377 [Gymnopilus junonius]|uniref:Uncharacterized protein n=1 Tax=Gymnopilus junonius TaxID=109634 RepID=A0A9P5NHW9_GYMJU|nr:hypothetical protein CPB84DRAFT_1849377 [Gymnopilus junonius]
MSTIIFYEDAPPVDLPNFASPDVSTFDGFLETCHRLVPSGSNSALEDQIKVVAKSLSTAERDKVHNLLLKRKEKREQARSFIRIMGWATDVDEEFHGLGFSDRAMDWRQGYFEVDEEDLVDAIGAPEIFIEAIQANFAPLPMKCREQMWWACRQWIRAGRPELDSIEVAAAMRKSGLLPEERGSDNDPSRIRTRREDLQILPFCGGFELPV